MSTYSSSLRVELITSGDQPGQWGNTTNNNFNYIFDKAIAGALSVTTTSLNHVLTYLDGPTPTASLNESVYAILKLDTTTGAAFNVFAPPVPKQYIIWNTSSTHAATIYNSNVYGSTTAAGAGVTIPAGSKVLIASDGTSFYSIAPSTFSTDIVVNGLTVGRGAGNSADNTVLGNSALTSNVSGVFLTAIGNSALQNAINGGSTAVGYEAAKENTTGIENVAIGYQALNRNTSGPYQTAVGSTAMYFMAGSSNTAVGTLAMRGSNITANNTGTNNVAIGYQTLFPMTSGQYNVAVGDYAGVSVSTGLNNTFVGYRAGFSVSTNPSNTFVGAEAGFVMTGQKNTVLGRFNGNQGGLNITTADNYIVLSDGDGNPRAYWNGADATFNGALTVSGALTASNALRTAVASASGNGTLTPTSNTCNQFNVQVTGGSVNFAAPSGSPTDGQKLIIRITDDSSLWGLTWNAIYREIGVSLPNATVPTKTIYVGCIYNTTAAKWDVVAVTTQA